MKSLLELDRLWGQLGDIPIDGDDCTRTSWLHFPVGTSMYDIWHWFEQQNPEFILGEKLQDVRFLCKFCKRAEVVYVAACEPWSDEHWACPACDSTFGMPEYV